MVKTQVTVGYGKPGEHGIIQALLLGYLDLLLTETTDQVIHGYMAQLPPLSGHNTALSGYNPSLLGHPRPQDRPRERPFQ